MFLFLYFLNVTTSYITDDLLLIGLEIWWLTLLSTIFQLYHDGHDLSQVTNKLYHIMMYRVHLTWSWFELTTLEVIGTDCICSYKSNYHTIKTTLFYIWWSSGYESTLSLSFIMLRTRKKHEACQAFLILF